MEEAELEEGEAFHNKDDDKGIDPDVSLSYIGEKLHNLLGYFTKDFERSAVNLGYNEYGSFLPTSQQSPSVRHQPKAPQRVQTHTTTYSPHNLNLKGAPQHSILPSDVPLSLRPGIASCSMHLLQDPKVTSADVSATKDSCILPIQVAEKLPVKHDPSESKFVSQPDQRLLKVRIKVGSGNTTRKNTAIYSGLGLVSPSSSTENSPKESGGMAIEYPGISCESPGSIVQSMTSFPVPGSLLLSPLHESLLCLVKKENIPLERKLVLPIKGRQKNFSISIDDSSSMPGDAEVLRRKKKKSNGESQVGLKDEGAIESAEKTTSRLKERKATETVERKQRLPNELKIKLSSNSITLNSLNDPVRSPEAYRESGKDVPVKKREIKKDWMTEKLLTPYIPDKESLDSTTGPQCGKYGQQDAKSTSMEHIDKQRLGSSHEGFPVVPRDGGTIKGSRAPSVSKSDSGVSKGEKDSIATATCSLEKKVGPNSSANQLDERKVAYRMESSSFEGKKKLNIHQKNGKSTGYLRDERVRSGVQLSKKDKKSVQKDVQMVRGSYKDVLDTEPECPKSQLKLLERPTVDKAEGHKVEAVKEEEGVWNGEPSTGALPLETAVAPANTAIVQENWVGCDRCEKWRLLPYGTKSDHLPDVWLCSMLNWLPGMNRCDISEDDTTNALIALYHCADRESEVNLPNDADRAVTGVTSADVLHFKKSKQNGNYDVMPTQGKKKHKSKSVVSSYGLMHTPKLTKDFREEALKSRSLNDMNQCLLDTNLNDDNARNPYQSCNFGADRHVPKQFEKHVNEGDMKHKKLKNKRESDQNDHGSFKKIKTEAAADTNKNWASEYDGGSSRVGHKSSSGLPSRPGVKDVLQYSEQCCSKNGNSERKDRFVISVKKRRDSTQVYLKSGSLDRKTCDEREVHAKKRKLRDWQDSQDHLETLGTTGNCLPDGKACVNEESNKGKFKKEKIFNIKGKGSSSSKGDDKSYKKGAVSKITSSASRDNSVDKTSKKDQQQGKHREKIASQGDLDDAYSSRKYLASEKISMAATSSSSKVSGSRKRAAFQEIRGSPVESVSSSPMRVGNVDKFSTIQTPRKTLDGKVNGGTNLSGTVMNREASSALQFESSGCTVLDYHDSQSRHKLGGKTESRGKPLSKSVNSHLVSNAADAFTGQRQSFSDIHVSDDCDIVSKQHQPDIATFPPNSGRGSSSWSKDRNRSSNLQRIKVKVSDVLVERDLTPKKIQTGEADIECHGFASQPEDLIDARHNISSQCSTKTSKDGFGKKGSGILVSDCRGEKPTKFRGCDGSEAKLPAIGSEKVGVPLRPNVIQGFEAEIPKIRVLTQVELAARKSQVSPCHAGKVDELVHEHQPLSISGQGSGFNVHPVDASGDRDVSKVLKQPVNAFKQSGVHQSAGNLAAGRFAVRDPIVALKEDTSNQAAKSALKEAELAKDLADRLKDSGFLEHNETYFEAALKFLYCASLLEACSSESSRQGEMDPMQIYSITAKLCETCAQEYDKRKEMAAAALAYKCMEVAYLKLVYCKNSSTNRDRQDLQASIQMIPQGESPSSSASDVDNLNNQATMDKAALSRGTAHAGNHIVIARNRPNFMRLLDFTNDVNSAMEASRKSQNALAAANIILEESQNKEVILSVKRVIDFSFQDIEELIHLVRNASKAISHPGCRGNRE